MKGLQGSDAYLVWGSEGLTPLRCEMCGQPNKSLLNATVRRPKPMLFYRPLGFAFSVAVFSGVVLSFLQAAVIILVVGGSRDEARGGEGGQTFCAGPRALSLARCSLKKTR
jgi:hypothetical protein